MKRLTALVSAGLLAALPGCHAGAPIVPSGAGVPGPFRTLDLVSGVALDWYQSLGHENTRVAPVGVAAQGGRVYALANPYNSGGITMQLQAHDVAGNLLWTRTVGGGGYAAGVAADDSGIYVVGNDAQDGPFVCKYDAQGQVVWSRVVSAAASDQMRAVAVRDGRVYVVGKTTPGLPQGDDGSVFLRRYDRDGSPDWTAHFGAAGDDVPQAVAVDVCGSVYVSGHVRPDPAVAGASGAAFLMKYCESGTVAWAKLFGTTGDALPGMAAMEDGLYVGGVGAGEAYLRRYGHEGQEIWTRPLGVAGDIRAVAAAGGQVYATMAVDGAWPGQTGAGDRDGLALRFDASGQPSGAWLFGTAGGDQVAGVAVADGRAYVAWSPLDELRAFVARLKTS